MTYLYGVKGSCHPLRPKNTIKMPTQSAEIWICMKKLARESEAILFLKDEKTQDLQIFSGALFAANAVPVKI